jgi:hypothetical protein
MMKNTLKETLDPIQRGTGKKHKKTISPSGLSLAHERGPSMVSLLTIP